MKLAIGISSFKNDARVASLLSAILGTPTGKGAESFVVDSIGTGAMPALVAGLGAPRVHYRCFPTNLGAAGNLRERLLLAANTDATHLLALNHDALFDEAAILRMIEATEGRGRLGALYPLRRQMGKGALYDVTGTRPMPFRFIGVKEAPSEPLLPVIWSSSNGALYSLAPAREGVLPRADLWHGWEDLDYGLSLRDAGFTQYIVTAARMDDEYEYTEASLGPVPVKLSDKPSWMAYYQARNLLLAVSRNQVAPKHRALAASRIALEYGVIALGRKQKLERMRYLTEGALDALRGRTGKWRLP